MDLDHNQSDDDASHMDIDVDQTGPPGIYQPNISVSETTIQRACGGLAALIYPHDCDDRIRCSLNSVWGLVHGALWQDQQHRGRLANQNEYQTNVNHFGEDKFCQLLRDMAKKRNWKDLFQHEFFFKPNNSAEAQWQESEVSENATVEAWSSDFKGNAADVLLATISDYLNKDRKYYARLANVVNSSGTGKSRMVDEISRKIISVPMCLRGGGSEGFPPSDTALRTWLLSAADPNMRDKAIRQLHAFVYALLNVTCRHLETIASEYGYATDPITEVPDSFFINRQEKLASVFRDRMTKGQTFSSQNAYRIAFYNQVIEMAREFMRHCEDNQKTETMRRFVVDREGVEEAGRRLCKFIDPREMPYSIEGSRRPLVIISFDESHILSDNPRGTMWTIFSELCHVFQRIAGYPIFSLFLSTAPRFNRFSPGRFSDPSTRIANAEVHFFHPICEISFDDIAFPSSEHTVSLHRVVEMDWICHLGRPLFGTRYDALTDHRQKHLMDFAQQKLLCGKSTLRRDNGPGVLACLSVRFGLEFNPDRASRAIACQQVERHMRLCLAAINGFEKLATISPSEPLLAEGARDLLQDTLMDPIDHLVRHSDLNCIDLGRRGELVAALIIMQARDQAAKEKRWMSVSEFMEALLPSAHCEELRLSMPTLWLEGERKSFSETFKGYGMWFNHVIRVGSSRMLSADNLWKFITRGAMIVCKDNHCGVDIVLPACLVEENLSKDTVTAIYIQVMNDKCKRIDRKILHLMDPFLLDLFSEGKRPRPIIRMVFALTSQENGVLFLNQGVREPQHPDKFTAFDVWCEGLSSNTFNNIGEGLESYRVLLDRSLQPFDTFDLNETKYPKTDPATKEKRWLQRQKIAALVSD